MSESKKQRSFQDGGVHPNDKVTLFFCVGWFEQLLVYAISCTKTGQSTGVSLRHASSSSTFTGWTRLDINHTHVPFKPKGWTTTTTMLLCYGALWEREKGEQ